MRKRPSRLSKIYIRSTKAGARDPTRLSLLLSAQALIASKGLAATSVEAIAAGAGYTRGAFYSNFRSKRALFIELLRCGTALPQRAVDEYEREDCDSEHSLACARRIIRARYSDKDVFMNWLEARVLAARDRQFREEIRTSMAAQRRATACLIRTELESDGGPEISNETTLMALVCLVDGLFLFMLSCTLDTEMDLAAGILGVFIEAIRKAIPAR